MPEEDFQQGQEGLHTHPPATPPPQSASGSLAVIEASPPGIREILSSVVNISESGKYYEPSCKFCSSRHRADAERMATSFDIGVKQSDAEGRIAGFFTSVGEQVSPDAVRNHVTSHMDRGDLELRKVEYISRLATLSGTQMTTLSQAKLAMAAVLECLGSIGYITPMKGLSPAKAQEMKANVVTKLVKTWTDLMTIQAKLNGELWDEGKMVAIPADDFHRVFEDALNSANTPDERNLIKRVLDGLTRSMEK